MVLYGYTHLHGQTLISAINADIFLTKAIEVENTGNFLSYCQVCKDNYAVAMCWDGLEPSIGVYDGTSATLAYLPQGAHDPDIIFGDNGQYVLVVYELNGGIDFDSYQVSYSPLSLTLLSQGTIANNARHPNIDMNLTGEVAVIYENLVNTSTNNFIHIRQSDLLGSFWLSPPSSYSISTDNKGQYIGKPQQSGFCYNPDLSISGKDPFGEYVYHVTFIQENPHLVWHIALEINPQPVPVPFNYYANNDAPSGLPSGMSQPRIACTKAVSTEFDYVMVHGNNNTVVQTHHISAVFGNGGLNTQVWIDWPLTINGSGYDPALEWIDDPFLNIAWSGNENGFTDDLDICVDQREPWSPDYYPNQWSRANFLTKKDQTEVSITGLRESEFNPHLFSYFWYTPQTNDLHFKTIEASATVLKNTFSNSNLSSNQLYYPNPCLDQLTIQVPEYGLGGTYEIYNVAGQLVCTGNLGANIVILHLEKLQKGHYFLQLKKDEWSFSDKLIIQ
jgi:hypothetical protein